MIIIIHDYFENFGAVWVLITSDLYLVNGEMAQACRRLC